ncbi:MAG TPA: polysaccharide biosynthesis/export family protein [Thermoanaerobaculia bacterium]|nr:polysaccharide biosynthesis/export family protein [Thermoanaerobaculia bacterium]
MKIHRRVRLLLALAALVALAPLAASAQEPSTVSTYRLGPKDLLRVKVFEVPELNVDSRVSETGTVNLPLIGEVPASGLTGQEFGASLKRLLEARYVNRANVSVEILEFRSRPITLIGSVKQPGNLAFPGRWTLLDALAAAGGLADSYGDLVYVLRRAENGLTDQLAIPVRELMVEGRPEANVPIFANDLINIPARVDISIYCLGEVRSPGELKFKSTERITVLSAIARAGGLTESASKKIRVKRREGGSLGPEIVVDYRRLLAGKEPDLELGEGDVLVVKEALF